MGRFERSLRKYLLVALLATAGLMAGHSAWRETVKIGCLPQGGASPPGTWLVACASDQVGSYELGAIWFGLDAKVNAGITRAKVLLFGDSRLLHAASNATTSDWFASREIPMYLLAFGNGEQSGWAENLVDRLKPAPQLVVFDADPYFTGQQSIPAQAITDDPMEEETTARGIRAFLAAAPEYCRLVPWLCGRTTQGFRQYLDGVVVHRSQGRVWFNRNQEGVFAIAKPGPQDTSNYGTYLANATRLLAKMHVDPQCVVFTIVPNSEMDDTLARFLAASLGGRVIAPWFDGLATTDHFHLTPESSEIWSKAFLAQLEPIARRCTEAPGLHATRGTSLAPLAAVTQPQHF